MAAEAQKKQFASLLGCVNSGIPLPLPEDPLQNFSDDHNLALGRLVELQQNELRRDENGFGLNGMGMNLQLFGGNQDVI